MLLEICLISRCENAAKGYRSTAQGLFNASMGGIGSAVGGFAGGLLSESMGARGMYFVLIFVALILVFAGLVRRTLPPEQ
jgi:MFS family permease